MFCRFLGEFKDVCLEQRLRRCPRCGNLFIRETDNEKWSCGRGMDDSMRWNLN